MRLGIYGVALLLAAAMHSAAADPASWRPWLAQSEPSSVVSRVTLPDASTLAALGADRAWLARWTGQPPSAAWNEVVAGLVVKYQQNPLRAARAYTYTHTAIHDALVICAQRG